MNNDTGGAVLFVGVVACAIAAVCFLVMGVMSIFSDSGPRQTCEQRGGQYKQVRTQPIWVGKVLIMQPIYECTK